jgi:hypothetical protein
LDGESKSLNPNSHTVRQRHNAATTTFTQLV